MTKGNARWLLLLLLAFTVTSCNYFSKQPDSSYQDATTANSDASSAEATLDGLEVAQPGSMSGYSREKFPHWSKASEFGWAPRSRPATRARPR